VGARGLLVGVSGVLGPILVPETKTDQLLIYTAAAFQNTVISIVIASSFSYRIYVNCPRLYILLPERRQTKAVKFIIYYLILFAQQKLNGEKYSYTTVEEKSSLKANNKF
jgi:hypothetical protein